MARLEETLLPHSDGDGYYVVKGFPHDLTSIMSPENKKEFLRLIDPLRLVMGVRLLNTMTSMMNEMVQTGDETTKLEKK